MKKTLVALAAIAATGAFAQQLPSGANPSPTQNGVIITGLYDVGYAAITYKGANKVNTVAHNGAGTSQITFVGVQDLGGGIKADFFFENDIIPTSYVTNPGVGTLNGTFTSSASTSVTSTTGVQAVSTWGNGQVKAGIGGSFGYVGIGAVNNAALDFNQMSNPFGTAWGGGYGITMATVGSGYGASAKVRYDNSVRYLTPELSAGLKGSLVYRPKNSQAANNMVSTTPGLQGQSGIQELAAIYMNGPLNFTFVNQIDDGNDVKNLMGSAQTAKKFTTNSIGGNYTVGKTTVYAAYQTMKNDTASTNNKAYRYGVKYQVSDQLALSGVSSYVTNASAAKTSLVGLGADYYLSKTVRVYGRYEAVRDDALLLASTESNGGTDAAPTTAVTATTAGFSTGAAFSDHNRTRSMIGLRVDF